MSKELEVQKGRTTMNEFQKTVDTESIIEPPPGLTERKQESADMTDLLVPLSQRMVASTAGAPFARST